MAMDKPSMNANADFILLLLGIFERGKYGERLTKDAGKAKRAVRGVGEIGHLTKTGPHNKSGPQSAQRTTAKRRQGNPLRTFARTFALFAINDSTGQD
jgi:hypothetical protein